MRGEKEPFQSRNADNACAKLEVCIQDCAGFVAAKQGGADRVELCAALSVGGLTPSAGMIEFASRQGIATSVLIRPRAGGFVYGPQEVEVMERDITHVGKCGLAGITLGAARNDGSLDVDVLGTLRAAAGNMELCLHRVFDLTPDPFEALEQVIDLGFSRILTSGQEVSALAGQGLLAELVKRAGSRITILGGAGITPDNVVGLVQKTGLSEVHASCRAPDLSPPLELRRFGFAGSDTGCKTDEQIIGAMIEGLENIAQPPL